MSLNDDKKYIWHPLTQHQLYPNHIRIKKAKGALLYDDKHKEYIDAISSWYTCMYGHCNTYITSRVAEQIKLLDHVVFTGFTHDPATKLAKELISILPENQAKLFFSDNGSTSVDVALKMAFQYHYNNGNKKNTIIAFEDGFHGDTFGAMSVSGLSIYNGPFEDYFLDVKRVPVPNKENLLEVQGKMTEIIQKNEVAAFIYEPLVQGAAGMKMHEPDHLNSLLKIAKKHHILTIADEVMTGFGKTGRYFASDYMNELPDIMCLSKSLTGGLVPMAITTCTDPIYNAFLSSKMEKGFFHGHTYSGNPTSCAAALASTELLKSDKIQKNIKRISQKHREFISRIKDHPKIHQTRQQGVILALDFNTESDRYGKLRYQLFDFYMKEGVYLRPLGNTVYILAPYVISDKELLKIYSVIEKSFDLV